MNRTCPRCGAAFACGAQDAEPCWCNTLTLSEATLRALREHYSSCLCAHCLRQLEPEGANEQRFTAL
jgi:hypothetical protein